MGMEWIILGSGKQIFVHLIIFGYNLHYGFFSKGADPQAMLFTNALGLGNALCFLESCGYGRELVSITGHSWA